MQDQYIKIGIQLRESLHRKLKEEAARRGENLYDLVNQAIEQFLGIEPPPEDPLLSMLRDILGSGQADVISATSGNVKLFHGIVRDRDHRHRSRGPKALAAGSSFSFLAS